MYSGYVELNKHDADRIYRYSSLCGFTDHYGRKKGEKNCFFICMH